MTGAIANTVPAWVAAFFGGSNGLTWSDIQGGLAPDGWGPEVLSWLEILERDEDGVALLPFLDVSGSVVWFGVACSERAGRRLGEDITGFIGATYGGFDGRPYMPDASDAPGTILSAALPSPMYRIAPGARGRFAVRRAIGIYRSLLERRPTARRLSARSVGAFRTRFDRALLAENEEEASRLYDEILATGRLSLENRHYLRVRLLAGLGRWTELAAEARLLRALADLTLPPQVRAELLDALYRTHIDPVEDPKDAGAALEEFRLKIAPFGRLFTMRQGLRQPRVVKAFLMNALLRAQPKRDELDELLALLPESPIEAGFSTALRDLVNARVPAQAHASASAADSAFDDLEFDHALRLYATIAPSRKSIARMIQCAHTIGTADAAHIALGALAASPDIEVTLPQPVRSIVEALRNQIAAISVAAEPASDAASAMQPGNWLDWTTWVAAGAQADEATRLVEQQSCNWEVETYLQYDAASALAHALEDAALTSPEIIQGAFPNLYQAFVGETEEAQAPLTPIYRALLSAVVLAPGRSGDDLELARTLAALVLETGLSEADYRNVTRELTELVRQDASVTTLDWALDLAEVIATSRSASPSDQMNLVLAVLEFARSRVHRLSKRQIEVVRALCADMDVAPDQYISGASDADPDEQSITALAARSIAIYTLAETAGTRALQILTKLVPGIDVALNSDKVCTDRLAALARNAELFVFAWRSSKHAAYYCIKDHRPKDMRILMPHGKGTASIVRAILET
ncbi:protein DpdD [Bradyrhizobium elkanii]|uniref:protein DpdD n=1 Tax=Bradyrhizobium elkanii TaxID=29448 RepID=UPI002714C063|nr:protein DpdD [Bradyrhizobium elkanii]WLB09484.1 protein DpdD [Bradyrhizobium elkanii]WLB72570.1 protein DpdD [Bradyrhizobium elkanii]